MERLHLAFARRRRTENVLDVKVDLATQPQQLLFRPFGHATLSVGLDHEDVKPAAPN
jgi:hypothetical protein